MVAYDNGLMTVSDKTSGLAQKLVQTQPTHTWKCKARPSARTLIACFTRFVATTKLSLATYVTLGRGLPARSTAHTSRRKVGALPASRASEEVVQTRSDRGAWPRCGG